MDASSRIEIAFAVCRRIGIQASHAVAVAAFLCIGASVLQAQENAQANPGAQALPSASPAAGQPAPTLEAQQAPALPVQGTPSAPIVSDDAFGAVPESSQGEASAQPASTLPHNLSPWGMFMAADWVVKAVMIGLAFASLVTWTVWLAKSLEIAASKARLKKALRSILGARRLGDAAAELGDHSGIGGILVRAAVEEMEMSGHGQGPVDAGGIKERVESRLIRIQAQAGRRLSRGTGALATIGSTAPFVGLFGTVWGVYHALVAIGISGAGTLDKVSGPVGEALIMTGLGLAVAVPAVIGYNALVRANRVLAARLDAFAYELHTFVCMGQALGHGMAPAGDASVRALPVRPVAA